MKNIEAGDIIKRGDGIAEVKSVESDDYLIVKAGGFCAWVHVSDVDQVYKLVEVKR